jgi:hypothetical protein
MTKRTQNDLALVQTQTEMERFGADVPEEIWGEPEKDISYLHTVLAQCGLPYQQVPDTQQFYVKRNGTVKLVMTRGVLEDPETEELVLQGLPYGPKPRLLLIHLCTLAKLRGEPTVDVGDSMSALMRDLSLSVTGGANGTIKPFKEQLNRLAATQMQLLFRDEDKVSMRNGASPIEKYDLWFPRNPKQRVLWDSEVTLSPQFFASLMDHNAVPLVAEAIRRLQRSPAGLDMYTWLAHRLVRIPNYKPAPISWVALQKQFGKDGADKYKFHQFFKKTLGDVLAVYKDAKVELTSNGIQLRQSRPPVSPKIIVNSR